MPKRTDIKSILIIGAGPIVIGQACEFDYSGVQACKALREEGYRIVLVNSNPATIMTDPELADATYIEPITPEIVERIIIREREMAIRLTRCCRQWAGRPRSTRRWRCPAPARSRVMASADRRQRGRDRQGRGPPAVPPGHGPDRSGIAEKPARRFARRRRARRSTMSACRRSSARPSPSAAPAAASPTTPRNSRRSIRGGLRASPTHEVLVEESVLGWKEYEIEVVRDRADNCIIICSIENVDPMGVHTGDSVTVAPALTLTDKEYQIMRNAAIAVLREIGVDTGGSNVQFAVNPDDGRLVIIEMNPRVSRSSALASKATGFPIAKIAAKLAVGYTLDELRERDHRRYPGLVRADDRLHRHQDAALHVREIPGRGSAAVHLDEVGRRGHGDRPQLRRIGAEGAALDGDRADGFDEVAIAGVEGAAPDDLKAAVKAALTQPTPDRLLVIAQAYRHGLSTAEIHAACQYDTWFLERIGEIVAAEEQVRRDGLPDHATGLSRLKQMGFSDARLARLAGIETAAVTASRYRLGVRPVYKRIDTCAAEFPSSTPYMYSCYEGDGLYPPECEAEPSGRDKVVILGGGPNRIGQGIEFDYCCVHAATACARPARWRHRDDHGQLQPRDRLDRLRHLRPAVFRAADRRGRDRGRARRAVERPRARRHRPVRRPDPAQSGEGAGAGGIPILGTSPDAIDLAEDRGRFQQLLRRLGLRQPQNGTAPRRRRPRRSRNGSAIRS